MKRDEVQDDEWTAIGTVYPPKQQSLEYTHSYQHCEDHFHPAEIELCKLSAVMR